MTRATLQTPGRRGPSRRVERVAALLVSLYALSAVTALFLVLLRRGHRETGLLEAILTGFGVPVGRSLVSFVVLVLLTGALSRRKRLALWAAGLFEAFSVLWSLATLFVSAPGRVSGHRAGTPIAGRDALAEAVGIVVSAAVLAAMIYARRAFPAKLARGSWWAALATALLGTVVALVVTRVLVARVTHGGMSDERRYARMAVLWSLGLDDLGGLPRPVQLVPEVTGLLLSLSIVAAVLVFFRSGRHRGGWTPGGELALRELVAQHGGADSLSYFATRRDKSVVFSVDGRAAIAYAVVNAVCLAAADPVGAREAWPDAIAAWKQLARTNGWIPAVVSASEDGARAYAAAGLSVLVLGDEAVLEAEQFAIDSTSTAAVRQAVNHARRAGVEVTVRRQRDIEPDELAELARCAEQWRDGVERGFSMTTSRYADPADGADTVVVARQEGRPVGVLTFVPWGRRGASLDAMRRSPDAPNGVTELMVTELMRQGERSGLSQVSLNFAVLRGVFADAERLGAPVGARAQATFLGLLDRFFQLESLYRSNQKYNPTWVPRYVCFEGLTTLPRVVVAIGRAEGFVGQRRMPTARLSDADAAAANRIAAAPIHLGELAGPRREQTQVRIGHREQLEAAGRLGLGATAPTGLRQLPTDWAGGLVAARIRSARDHGGVIFLDLVDRTATAQAVCERDALPDWELFCRAVDLGDLMCLEASPGQSRTGTPSLLVTDWRVLAKSLHPVPFGRFTDAEARARNRSLDLLVNGAELDVLTRRSQVVAALRRHLLDAGFNEVETPILGLTHGGASARPFRTYINAYNSTLYLRIAPELALKRLLVAGAGPIFEIARNFRNEGADASHNPEFTALEAYLPYGDYDSMRELTQDLIRAAATAVHGRPVLPLRQPDGSLRLTDVSAPWPVVSMSDAVSDAVGRRVGIDTDVDTLTAIAKEHGVELGPDMGPGAVLEELYGELVEPATTFPTFYRDFPEETSPLTGKHRSIPGLTERWDLVANGMELGTAYSELVDPVEQRRRLTQQSLKAAAGDAEAMELDEDFLRALELGMPPTGGLGIGVDRVAMLVTGTQIRDVLTFPFVKPRR